MCSFRWIPVIRLRMDPQGSPGRRQIRMAGRNGSAVWDPDLVEFSDAGEPEMVRSHFLPPLLLNELQKQQKTIEKQNEVIAGLEARLARLEARLSAESRR